MARRAIVFGIDGLVLPLVEHLVGQGRLPHFARLFREGSLTKVLPFVSTWGSINWSCFATGASPGTAWQGRVEVPPFASGDGSPASGYSGDTLWQALARQGRSSLLLAYPGSWPPGSERCIVVAPDPGESNLPLVGLAKPARYMTEALQARYKRPPGTRAGWIPLAQRAAGASRSPSLSRPDEPAGWRNLPARPAKATRFALRGVGGRTLAELGVLLFEAGTNHREVWLCDGLDAARILSSLRVGKWTDWLTLALGEAQSPATVRVKLLEISADGRELALCHSEVQAADGLAFPRASGRRIVASAGPYAAGSSAQLEPHDPFWTTAVEEAGYEGAWMVRAVRSAAAAENLSLFMTVFRPVDAANHGCLAFVDPESRFRGGRAGETAAEILAQTYGMADSALGSLMELADGDTIVAVASDHGAVVNDVMCDVYHLLMEHGLLAIEECDGTAKVDWARTRAYIRPTRTGSEVFVNLAGREAQGIVPPGDYAALQEQIVDLLLDWREPGTGRRAVALALKKKDAALLGYWGESAGDVQFIYNSGFVWGELPLGQSIARSTIPSVNHGPQIATTETSLSSNMGMLALWGPGVRRGYRRPESQLGPVRMSDPAPTLAHLLGIAPPLQSEGAILRDMLDP